MDVYVETSSISITVPLPKFHIHCLSSALKQNETAGGTMNSSKQFLHRRLRSVTLNFLRWPDLSLAPLIPFFSPSLSSDKLSNNYFQVFWVTYLIYLIIIYFIPALWKMCFLVGSIFLCFLASTLYFNKCV